MKKFEKIAGNDLFKKFEDYKVDDTTKYFGGAEVTTTGHSGGGMFVNGSVYCASDVGDCETQEVYAGFDCENVESAVKG